MAPRIVVSFGHENLHARLYISLTLCVAVSALSCESHFYFSFALEDNMTLASYVYKAFHFEASGPCMEKCERTRQNWPRPTNITPSTHFGHTWAK